MANTLITPQIVAKEALMLLENNMVAGALASRAYQTEFGGAEKVGDTIDIRVKPTFTLHDFEADSSAIVVQDITETNVQLQIEKHYDVSIAVTSKDWTLELDDFSERVLEPMILPIAEGVDSLILDKALDAYYNVGTKGDPPDSLADVIDINTFMNKYKIPTRGRRAILDAVAEGDMLKIPELHRTDMRGDFAIPALNEAEIRRFSRIDWFLDQNVKAHTVGTMRAQTPVTDGIDTAGSTTIDMDGGVGAETFLRGDLFTIANVYSVIRPTELQQFVCRTDSTASSGAIAALPIWPALPEDTADGAAITIVDSHTKNLVFTPQALTLAIVPLALPVGAANARYVDSGRGFGLRMVWDYNSTNKKDVLSLDLLVATKLVDPAQAVIDLG